MEAGLDKNLTQSNKQKFLSYYYISSALLIANKMDKLDNIDKLNIRLKEFENFVRTMKEPVKISSDLSPEWLEDYASILDPKVEKPEFNRLQKLEKIKDLWKKKVLEST